MIFKDFLLNEIKDNGTFQIIKKEEDSYTYSLHGHPKDKEIKVEKYYGKGNDSEINDLLFNVSSQLKEKLTNKAFIRQNLFLFNDEEYEHNSQDNFIDYVPGFGNKIENAVINTNNLIGYVNKKHNGTNYSIVVSSRFGDKFLKHLIASTDGFLELPDSGDTNQNGMAEWLLTFLWKVKLKHAYRLGLPKEYVSKSEKTVSFRGNMTINNAIINPEFIPPYDCNFREHSYDNDITQLITNTFRLVENKTILEDCHKIRQDFNTATKGKRIPINDLLNFKPIKNPYYSDYNEVAGLSQKIIKREMADFSSEKDNFSAFFFDISMLFEHFIRKLFIRKGFVIEEKNAKQYFIPSGGYYNNGKRKLFPDIIIRNNDETISVYDVKYKRYDFVYGVSREDLFQLNTYIGQLLNVKLVKRCGFIFPIEEDNPDFSEDTITQELNIGGIAIAFEIIFFKIPVEGNKDYSESFHSNVNNFYSN